MKQLHQTASEGGREYHGAKPDYLYRTGRQGAACPSLNIWQEKQDNCSGQVHPRQDVSCAFVWSGTPNQACTQMELDSLFWDFSSSPLSTVENRKGLCVLEEYVSKSSSSFVWNRIKRSRAEMKIKRCSVLRIPASSVQWWSESRGSSSVSCMFYDKNLYQWTKNIAGKPQYATWRFSPFHTFNSHVLN